MSVSSVYLSLFTVVKLCKLRLIFARLIPSGQLRFVFSSSCSSNNSFSFLSLPFFSCFFQSSVPRWAVCLFLRGKFHGAQRFTVCCFGRRSPLKANKTSVFCFQESWQLVLFVGGGWSGARFMSCLGFPQDSIAVHLFVWWRVQSVSHLHPETAGQAAAAL